MFLTGIAVYVWAPQLAWLWIALAWAGPMVVAISLGSIIRKQRLTR